MSKEQYKQTVKAKSLAPHLELPVAVDLSEIQPESQSPLDLATDRVDKETTTEKVPTFEELGVSKSLTESINIAWNITTPTDIQVLPIGLKHLRVIVINYFVIASSNSGDSIRRVGFVRSPDGNWKNAGLRIALARAVT